MITPTGASVNYAYALDGIHRVNEADEIARNTLRGKTITHGGAADTWAYFIENLSGTVTGPDGSSISENAYLHDPGVAGSVTIGKGGLVYRTNRSNKTMTERHWTLMPFSGGYSLTPGGTTVQFNAVVDAEYTSLLDDSPSHNPIKMSARTFQYDFNGNLVQETVYDWFDPALVSRDSEGVPTGVPGAATVLRVVNNSYYNPATSSDSANVYAKRALSTALPLILNALQQNTVGPSVTQFSYDGQAYGVVPAFGNLTSQSTWDDVDTKWITSRQTYGPYGNLATKTDARGETTQFFFDDTTHALPNRVVVDPENGSGVQTTTTAYDYWTGLVTSQTDANGQVSTVNYTNQLLGTVDPFGRPGIVFSPPVTINGSSHRRRVTKFYEDAARRLRVESDLNAEGDRLLKSRTTSDQIGRPVLTELSEDGSTYTISSSSVYLQMGKITLTSSRMRPTAAATDSWTRTTRDNAGRVIELATFGGAAQPPSTGTNPDWTGSVITEYDANLTTVTDQSGIQRESAVDGLGRLNRVYEAPNNPNFNYLTSYVYDALSNLIMVTQGGQQRFFMFDSLSRLRRARNPEQGININLNLSDPKTGNNQWSMGYNYDDNGNLLTKIDARGVTSTYAYDAFNRNISVSYDDTETPPVSRYYDGWRDGVNNNIPNSKGRLWLTETGGPNGSRTASAGFDELGRPLKQHQQFFTGSWSQNYSVQRTYDLAGNVVTQTYPSGHTVNYVYDGAGRISSFTGNLGEGVPRSYATDFQYTPWGTQQQEKFGTTTPLYHKQRYNSRGQLWDMRLSTVPFGTDPANGDRGAIVNYYSTTYVQGGSGVDNNGNLRRQEIYIPGNGFFQDTFAYDDLNRLTSISEKLNGTGNNIFKQAYEYDRWGNRLIDQVNTSGDVPRPEHTVDETTNRLNAPEGYLFEYDEAGNQTLDNTLGSQIGQRIFDGENRITAVRVSKSGLFQWSYYAYNGDGQRVRSKVLNYEIWQVYGFDGELLAEYPQTGASVAVSQPQKEYGYRNGELLVTAEPFTNLAWNKPATQIDNFSLSTTATKAVNGNADGDLTHGHAAATNSHLNSWWQVDLQSVQAIDSITVWGRTDCCPEMSSNFYIFVSDTPFTSYDLTTTLQQAGVSNYLQSGYAGPASQAVNRTGRYVRVQIMGTQALALAEVQIWNAQANVNWLLTDQLGTPRLISDRTGSSAGVTRHDYLPFGEEMVVAQGRTTALGYTTDTVRQKFTAKERDNETGLDYFLARYYSSTQGRFTGPDAPFADQSPYDPQSWNLYTYVRNNPLRFIDPDGRAMDGDFLEKVRNKLAGFGFQTDAEVKAETFRRRCEILHFTSQTPTPTLLQLSDPNTGGGIYLSVMGLSQRQVWDISDMIRNGEYRIDYLDLADLVPLSLGTAKQIADGHAWQKHQKEFPGWNKDKFTNMIDETIKEAKGSNVRNLSKGRKAYWNDKEKMVVIRDPKSPDGGTAFRPVNGKQYFINLK